MARNPSRPMEQTEIPRTPADTASPPMLGGTPGITPEASATIHYDPGSALATQRKPEPIVPGAARSKSYRVMNGGNIMINQCRTPVRAGKVIAEHEFDLDMLRQQGIILEEIKLAE